MGKKKTNATESSEVENKISLQERINNANCLVSKRSKNFEKLEKEIDEKNFEKEEGNNDIPSNNPLNCSNLSGFIEEINESIKSVQQEYDNNQTVSDLEKLKEKFGGEITNAWDLYSQDIKEVPYLLEDLIPEGCLSALVGPSESNKSNFMLGAAYAICFGNEYLGKMVNVQHNRVLIVPTEDITSQTAFRLKKQLEEGVVTGIYTKEMIERVHFAFGIIDVAGFIAEYLKIFRFDCIFIDAYGDINSTDTNSLTETRTSLKPYHDLCVEHRTAICFIHHSKKGSENLSPSKNDAVGSVGFEGKMRAVLGTRVDKNDPRIIYLMILKSNCIAPEKKKEAMVLRLKEDLTLEYTGNTIPIHEVQHSNPVSNYSKKNRDERVMELLDDGVTHKEIIDIFAEESIKISQSTISRILNKKN